MANRAGYIERDRHGRERVVISSGRRSSSRTRLSNGELLNAAEEREQRLLEQNHDLQDQLSWSKSNEHTLQSQLQNLTNEHYECRPLRERFQTQLDATRALQGRLADEKEKNAVLEEKLRLLRRTNQDGFRQKYEEVLKEVDDLKAMIRDRDDLIRLHDAKLTKQTQVITGLETHLRRLGYRVVVD